MKWKNLVFFFEDQELRDNTGQNYRSEHVVVCCVDGSNLFEEKLTSAGNDMERCFVFWKEIYEKKLPFLSRYALICCIAYGSKQ